MKREYTTTFIAQRLMMFLSGTNNPEEFKEHIAGKTVEQVWEEMDEHNKDDYRFASIEMAKLFTKMMEEA